MINSSNMTSDNKITKSDPRILLTPREKEIVFMICNDYKSKQIANKLCIELSTVKTHRIHIMKKTNSKTLFGLFRYAMEMDIIEVEKSNYFRI